MTTIAPIHPGEILMKEFLEPLQVSQNRLAIAIGVPPRRINEIVHGKRRVTADTALRLARYFGTTDRFWLNLQTRYDLEVEKDHLGNTLDRIEPPQSRLTHTLHAAGACVMFLSGFPQYGLRGFHAQFQEVKGAFQ